MNVPRVSVIIAAHDAAATLEEALASVHAQTFPDWEAVVVDDGSTDDTTLVARAAGKRVRLLRNDRSQGPAAARNRGVREARGELFAVLDADDLFKPEYLASQITAYDAAVSAERRVGAVCCDAEYLGPDGPTAERWSDRVGRVERVDCATLLRENVVYGEALVSRAVFLELGGYDDDPEMTVEDYDLWLRMCERGFEIVVNPLPLAYYRLGARARSSQVEHQARGARLMLDRALDRGALSGSERRLARRRRRAFGAVERRARVANERRPWARTLAALRAAPLVVVVVLEHPERWWRWVREGPRTANATRHTGISAGRRP